MSERYVEQVEASPGAGKSDDRTAFHRTYGSIDALNTQTGILETNQEMPSVNA